MPDPLITFFNLTEAGSSKSLKTNHLSLLGKGVEHHVFQNIFETHLGGKAGYVSTLKHPVMNGTKSIVPKMESGGSAEKKINAVPNFQASMVKSGKKGQRNEGLHQNVSSLCPSQKRLPDKAEGVIRGSDTLIIAKKQELQSNGVPQENEKMAVRRNSPFTENRPEAEENVAVIEGQSNGTEFTDKADNDNRIHTNDERTLHSKQNENSLKNPASIVTNTVRESLSTESGKTSEIIDKKNTSKQLMRDEPHPPKNQTVLNNGEWKNYSITELTDETELPTVAMKSVSKNHPQMVTIESKINTLSANGNQAPVSASGKVPHSGEVGSQEIVGESGNKTEAVVDNGKQIDHTPKMGQIEIQPRMVSIEGKESPLTEAGKEESIQSAGTKSHAQKTRVRPVEEGLGNKEKIVVDDEEQPHDAKVKLQIKKQQQMVSDRGIENKHNNVDKEREVRSPGKSFDVQMSHVHGIRWESGDGNEIQVNCEDSQNRTSIKSAAMNGSYVVSESSDTMIPKGKVESRTIRPSERVLQSMMHDNPKIVNSSLRNVKHSNESPRMKVANGIPVSDTGYSSCVREMDASPVVAQHAARNIVSENGQTVRFVNTFHEPNRAPEYAENDTVWNTETGSDGESAFKDANIFPAPEKTMAVSSLGQQDIRPSPRFADRNNPIQNIKVEGESAQPSRLEAQTQAFEEKGDNPPMRWEMSDTSTRETVIQERLSPTTGMERLLKTEMGKRPTAPPLKDVVVHQIMPSMVRMVKEGRSRVTMALHPKELGRLRMELIAEKGRMDAKFFVESGDVKETLERSLPELRTGLEKQGIEVHQFDVEVAREFSRPSDHGERMMKGNGEDLNAEKRSSEEVLDEDTGQESRKGPRYFGYNSMEIYA